MTAVRMSAVRSTQGFSSAVIFSRAGLSNGGGEEAFAVSRPSAAGWPARAVMAATGNAGGTTVGDDSEGAGGGSDSSRLGGRTIRANSVIFALRRKMEPKASGRGRSAG